MLVKVKIFDDVSGEEEEAVIVVPDEAEEEELLQNEEFIIRPCRLYEVSSKSSYYPLPLPGRVSLFEKNSTLGIVASPSGKWRLVGILDGVIRHTSGYECQVGVERPRGHSGAARQKRKGFADMG